MKLYSIQYIDKPGESSLTLRELLNKTDFDDREVDQISDLEVWKHIDFDNGKITVEREADIG